MIGLSCIFYFGAVLQCPLCRTNMRDPRRRVLQYVHGSLMVGCESDRSLNSSKWGMTYGSKEDFILNVMVGFHELNDLW